MTENEKKLLNKGNYKCDIVGDCDEYGATVFEHRTNKNLYVVEFWNNKTVLTTVVEKKCYRKEIDTLFFKPMTNALWNGSGVFRNIKKNRVAVEECV